MEPPPHFGAAVLLVDRAGRILLQQRDDDVPPAGYGRWAVPGGHAESGETPRETALREFLEETGVQLTRLRAFAALPGWGSHGEASDLHVFFADDEVDEARIEVNEGLAFRFFAPEAIASLPMNPRTRELLDAFLAHDMYRGHVQQHAPFTQGAAVIALDRWGRVLMQRRDADLPPERFPDQWSLPGGLVEPSESPDAAALREFEEETGHLLEELKLYRSYHRASELPGALVDLQHIYYGDPDIPEDAIVLGEGQAMRYVAKDELAALSLPPHTRTVLTDFFVSPAYKALFH